MYVNNVAYVINELIQLLIRFNKIITSKLLIK